MNTTQKISIGIIIILVILAGAGFVFLRGCQDDWCYIFDWQKEKAADSFERCAQLGFPVMESYPRQCNAGDKHFVEKIPVPNVDLIRVTVPVANTFIKSPYIVRGEARGTWYFEASFPVRIYDANGKELVATPAQAKSDWMTTEFVPFEATLTFAKPTTPTGTIVFQKDNPSGLPENEASVTVPVRFAETTTSGLTTESSVTVLSPNGGEKLTIGQTYEIKWSANVPANLRGGSISLIIENKNAFCVAPQIGCVMEAAFSRDLPGAHKISDGKYLWQVGKAGGGASDIPPGEYYLRIQYPIECAEYSSTPCLTFSDRSNAAFTISK